MIFVTVDRLLQIGVMYSIMVVLFLFLGMKVLKRGKQITNKMMGLYFVWMGLTLILNVVYVIVDIPVLTATLANVVGASMLFAQVFLLLFVLIVRHSQAEITKKKQAMWIAIAGAISISLFLVGSIGGGAIFGNTNLVDPTKNNVVPVWEPYYALIFFLGALFLQGLSVYNCYVARKGFTDATMRKRFGYFLLGMILLIAMMCLNPWANLEAASALRSFYGLFAIVVLPATFLLYMSLGKEVAKKE